MAAYVEAIKILGTKDIDFKALCFEIAAYKPSSIVDAAKRLRINTEPAWLTECRQLVAANQKIPAIKLYRSATNSSLKEAKEACDKLQ
jgi:ribosomal protein L7/L12